jgi:thermostable 8-oxoguanine DNA glycosylase
LIAQAAEWVNGHRPLSHNLAAHDDESARRDFLCDCPGGGVGVKTGCWLLLNVGVGVEVAFIYYPVLRALGATGRITEARLPRDYCAIERCFLAWCDELNAPPAAFDLMLWEWQRAL